MTYPQERRERITSARKKPLTRLANVFFVFLIGYVTANFFNFTQLTGWIHQITGAAHQTPAHTKVSTKPKVPKPKFEFYTLLEKIEEDRASSTKTRPHLPAAAATVATKPVLPIPLNLANKNTIMQKKGAIEANASPLLPKTALVSNASAQLTKAATMDTQNTRVTSAQDKNTYWIQVAAFKGKTDAERLKVTLTLKGFDVKIRAIASQQGQWFRVLLGPYPSKNVAEKMQLAIAQNEHIQGMVYRL